MLKAGFPPFKYGLLRLDDWHGGVRNSTVYGFRKAKAKAFKYGCSPNTRYCSFHVRGPVK